MATKPTKKPSGSVNVSLRLDPKTKFLIDLISRSHKRTITGVIEWAVERVAQQEHVGFAAAGLSLAEIADRCWSSEEHIRLIQINQLARPLLTYEEQRIIDTINNTPNLLDPNGEIDVDMVRDHWVVIKSFVEKTANEPVAPGLPKDVILPF